MSVRSPPTQPLPALRMRPSPCASGSYQQACPGGFDKPWAGLSKSGSPVGWVFFVVFFQDNLLTRKIQRGSACDLLFLLTNAPGKQERRPSLGKSPATEGPSAHTLTASLGRNRLLPESNPQASLSPNPTSIRTAGQGITV